MREVSKMSCGCGCDGHGPCRKGLIMPMGIMQVGSMGVPKPLTAGLGLGSISCDENGVCTDTQVSQIPTESPYPVVISTPVYTPAGTPSTSSATQNLLNSLAASWSGAAQQILKSNAGALPTYQQVGPGGSTTVYGNASNLPTTLQTSLLSATAGSSGLFLIGGAVLLAVMLFKR